MHRSVVAPLTPSRIVASALLAAAMLHHARAARSEPVPHPLVMLVRDPAVQKELGLDAQQAAAVAAAAAQVDVPLFRLRDVEAEKRAERVGQLVSGFRARLDAALRPAQKQRLTQLEFRAGGLPAMVADPFVACLNLSDAQTDRIRRILQEADAEAAQIAEEGATGKSAEAVRAASQRKIFSLLSAGQQKALAELAGEPFDLAQVRHRASRAPELEDIAAWINTEALKLDDLRGKVVALHFYAFGCINCVRNFPHYKAWHRDYADKGLVVLGVHTPETAAERDVAAVRRRAAEAGLAFPIAVDARGKTWTAWANRMWPSVYLIDKQGHVRRWWYGELNWKGAQGEKLLRAKIEELLAEK